MLGRSKSGYELAGRAPVGRELGKESGAQLLEVALAMNEESAPL